MPEPDKRPGTLEELLVSSLAQTDALAIQFAGLPFTTTVQRSFGTIVIGGAAKRYSAARHFPHNKNLGSLQLM
jgi:hypothetical protein